MNAPKEYYPAGYEKNFDDNFTTKVDLPATTFHCGDQKHFPGLYADTDLGCMVRKSLCEHFSLTLGSIHNIFKRKLHSLSRHP